MSKLPKNITLKINLQTVVIILIALVIGFYGGLLYANHHDNDSTNSPTNLNQLTHICNCPNIPVGTNPAQYCKC